MTTITAGRVDLQGYFLALAETLFLFLQYSDSKCQVSKGDNMIWLPAWVHTVP